MKQSSEHYFENLKSVIFRPQLRTVKGRIFRYWNMVITLRLVGDCAVCAARFEKQYICDEHW